jgi:hypothetical protein
MRHRAAVLTAALAIALMGVDAPRTLATFTSTASASGSFAALTVAPPTSLTGTGGTTATLNWTPTTTAQAGGYYVLRSATSGSGYTQVKSVTPATLATTADAPAAGTWYYVLQAYAGTWTSATSSEASVIVSNEVTTALKGCASNAPVTTGSGDNNGYQTNPGNACAKDGSVAQDLKSGTNTVSSCTNSGKDRHTFWGYAFGLPGTVSAVNGISVELVVGQTNTSGPGPNMVCAEVSGDGGLTWSAPQTGTLTTTSLTTFDLGGTADLWGHGAWSLGQLSSSNFRIRITDVSTQSTKGFSLDYVGASVTYTP